MVSGKILCLSEYAGLFERLSYGILYAWLRLLAINMIRGLGQI